MMEGVRVLLRGMRCGGEQALHRAGERVRKGVVRRGSHSRGVSV